MQELNLLVQLELLAQAFPWNQVEITIKRKPEGTLRFSAWINANADFGQDSSTYVYGTGDTAEEAVKGAIAQADKLDPALLRNKMMTELKAKLEKLQAMVIGLPPYVPNRELCEHNPELAAYKPQPPTTIIDV